MTVRFASVVAALAVAVASPATYALAQSYTAPAGIDWQFRQSDVETTGSLVRGQIDSSAKGGNAGQPERSVPQYGNTSGGPAH